MCVGLHIEFPINNISRPTIIDSILLMVEIDLKVIFFLYVIGLFRILRHITNLATVI